MSKIMHCRIQMFDRKVTLMIEEDGKITQHRKVDYDGYEEQVANYAEVFGVDTIHLIGNKFFLNGVAKKLNNNTKFKKFEIKVN